LKQIKNYPIITSPFIKTASNNLATKTASKILDFFFDCGKKANMESIIHKRVIGYAIKNFNTTANIANLFKTFYTVTTPFIGLKTRRKRRGKSVLNKLRPLRQIKGERIAIVSLSQTVCSSNTNKAFSIRLEQELKSIKSTNSSQQEKNKLLYQAAYKVRPKK